MSSTSISGSPLASELERRRLEHRERRVLRVVGTLRRRRDAYRAAGAVPAALGSVIRDFDDELARIRRRLDELRSLPV
jgi:hypothetical protein